MSEFWSAVMSWNWSVIVAWFALILGLGNTWWNIHRERNKPIDERQRTLRDDVRTRLKVAKEVAQPLIQLLRKGEIPPGTDPPEVLLNVHGQMVAITKDGLKVPDSSHVTKVTLLVSYIGRTWRTARQSEDAVRMLAKQSDPDDISRVVQARSVAQQELLEMLRQFVSQVDEMLEALAQIDDGDKAAIKKWRVPRTVL